MQLERFDIGADVYRSTTVRGPYPPFDSAWGAFRRACALFWRCLPDLVKVTAPVLVPVALVGASAQPFPLCLEEGAWWWPAGIVLRVLAGAWSTGVALHVARRHVEGRVVDRSEARAVGRALALRMLAVRVRYWIEISIGYFLWFVPGLYWAGQSALAEPAVYFERAAAGAAIRRSAELTRGAVGRALGATLLALLASTLAVLSLPYLCGEVLHAFGVFGPASIVAIQLPYELAIGPALMFVSVLRLVMYLGVVGEPPARAGDAGAPAAPPSSR